MKLFKKRSLIFAVPLIVTLVTLIYYFTGLGDSICSDFSDCSEDEYCGPLNHYKDSYSAGDDPKYTVFVESMINNSIKIKEKYVTFNNKNYKYTYKKGNFYSSEISQYVPEEKYIVEKTSREIMYAPLFLIIQNNGKDYGVCQKKPENYQPEIGCGRTTRLPDRIEKGEFKPYYAIVLDCT